MEKEPKVVSQNNEEEEEEVSIPVVPGEVRFQTWPSIVQFHNITTAVKRLPAIETELGRALYPMHYALEKEIEYRSKIKLHGMNVGITVEDVRLEGEEQAKFGLKVQSRTQFIPPTSGSSLSHVVSVKFPELEKYFINLGNPAQFETSSKILQAYKTQPFKKITFFGEWAGPGVQSSVAVSRIPHPAFFVFSIQIDDLIFFDPLSITDILTSDLSTLSAKAQSAFHDYFHIIPWFCESYQFNFADPDSLTIPLNKINSLVDQIDQEDPYILQLFKIKGPGEGLVWFPTSLFLLESTPKPTSEAKSSEKVAPESLRDHGIPRANFSKFVFKTKGEKHRVVATKTAVSVEPEKAANAKEYARIMVTEQRCEQGIKEGKIELKKENVGKFINWITNDVKKEGQDELKASGLDWKAAQKTVTEAAREWFMKKVGGGGGGGGVK